MKKITLLFVLICSIVCCSSYSFAQSGIIITVAGNGFGAGLGSGGYSGDGGPATLAELGAAPPSVAVDGSGNIYIADEYNNVIRKVNASGVISNFAGNGTGGFLGDGGAATLAELYYPTGVAVDASGNVYIDDLFNNVIRKVNTSGIISTVAGDNFGGFSGDGGPATAAELDNPWGIAIDVSGNLYISDRANYRIRMVNTAGIISTIAGNGTPGYTGDGGPAIDAELYYTDEIALDGSGNLYLADLENNAIRKVNTSGIISTVAGNGYGAGLGTGGYTGDGGPATAAEMYFPAGVTVDAIGNIYFSDYENNVVRKVNTSGTISTIAGNGYGAGLGTGGTGAGGYTGDGGPATAAELDLPGGLAVDASGNLYIADSYNNVVRKVSFHPDLSIAASPSDTVCAATTVTYSATVTNGDTISYQWYVDNATISGGTNSSYTYTPANGDSVKCICINSSPYYGVDTLTSNIIHMVVNPIVTDTLTITVFPGFKVCNGTAATFSVTGGASPYEWVVNGSVISGAAGTSYTYVPANGDSVRCATVAACNMGGSNTINMIVAPIITPTISISASPTTTAAGSVVTVTATFSVTGSYTINWYDNGTLLGTTTTDSITYTKTSDTDHITATIIPVSGLPECYDSAISNVAVVNDSTLGTSALPSQQVEKVNIFPNPAGGILHIDRLLAVSSYTLSNAVGQVVQRGALQTGSNQVSLSGITTGVYLLQITNERENRVFRVVKE